ncbi:MAG: ammonia-forming cytochrome c nitrite reductase subunit c552 [Planctomycetota bacterium]
MPQLSLHRVGERGVTRTALLLFLAALVGTVLVAWVLVVMFGRKMEARQRFVRLAQVSEVTTDPASWAVDFPDHYEGYIATAGDRFYGGSSAMPASKLDHFPWLKRLYAGYAFSLDYREARGHAYMLYDQGVTERVTKKPQAGACLHCHGWISVLYRKVGAAALVQPTDTETLAANFDMPAVMRGFQELSRKPYQEVLELLQQMPDGTPTGEATPFPQAPAGGFTGEYAGKQLPEGHQSLGDAHPVSCIDCHEPWSMRTRITRPGFVHGIQALAAGDAPVPHLPSIERWRRGSRAKPYDPNIDATRQEMRSFVCGQCHVEYYCANKDVLSFPWGEGLRMDDLEKVWEDKDFPDGSAFFDYRHGETGAPVFKVQHPEFEMWSQGIHARNGVSCADCHMPYQRRGAAKLSSHDVRSPLATVTASCQTCHNVPEVELVGRVTAIQDRTAGMLERAAAAMTAMLDAILEAQAAGVDDATLAELHALQRKAMWRLDYISSENSRGFHAPQEAARTLAESIDYSRQATVLALRSRAPAAPDTSGLERRPIQGVSRPDER